MTNKYVITFLFVNKIYVCLSVCKSWLPKYYIFGASYATGSHARLIYTRRFFEVMNSDIDDEAQTTRTRTWKIIKYTIWSF